MYLIDTLGINKNILVQCNMWIWLRHLNKKHPNINYGLSWFIQLEHKQPPSTNPGIYVYTVCIISPPKKTAKPTAFQKSRVADARPSPRRDAPKDSLWDDHNHNIQRAPEANKKQLALSPLSKFRSWKPFKRRFKWFWHAMLIGNPRGCVAWCWLSYRI